MTTLERIRKDPRVEDVWNEGDDGYWVMLKSGFKWSDADTHAVHEWSLSRLLKSMREVVPCTCKACKAGK
jgi:hypothetical protein